MPARLVNISAMCSCNLLFAGKGAQIGPSRFLGLWPLAFQEFEGPEFLCPVLVGDVKLHFT